MLTPLSIAQKFFPEDAEKRKELMDDIKRFDNSFFTDQEQLEKALTANRTLLESICMRASIPLDGWVNDEIRKFCLFKVEKDEIPIKRTAAFAGIERWILNAKQYQKKTNLSSPSSSQFGNGVVI
jgi:hypothetical protein